MEAHLSSAIEIVGASQSQLVHETPELKQIAANTIKNGLPPIAIGPSQGALLTILCQMINAKNILEIGTLGGYSTYYFAKAVPGAQVTSLEINPKHRDVALENLQVAGVADQTNVILGPAMEIMPKLLEEGEVFDFVFVDANWEEQAEYVDLAVKMTRKGGIVFVDNAVRALTQRGGEGGKRLIEKVKADERVTSVLMPTLLTYKEHLETAVDGFLMAIVK